jgi:hypothetical protein
MYILVAFSGGFDETIYLKYNILSSKEYNRSWCCINYKKDWNIKDILLNEEEVSYYNGLLNRSYDRLKINTENIKPLTKKNILKEINSYISLKEII